MTKGNKGHCAAFINFVDKEDGMIFMEKFNNYMVLDHKGNDFYMKVDVAMNQCIPKISKEDPLKGTIKETDSYKAFRERYNLVSTAVLGFILNEHGPITSDVMIREIDEKKERQKRKLCIS